jgi:hypothetical protein
MTGYGEGVRARETGVEEDKLRAIYTGEDELRKSLVI